MKLEIDLDKESVFTLTKLRDILGHKIINKMEGTGLIPGMHKPIHIFYMLQEETGKAIPKNTFESKLVESGYTVKEAMEVIDDLKSEGEIYEESDGMLKMIR